MEILICKPCSRYTLEKECPLCGKSTGSPRPPKYSPEDKYTKYRAEIKIDERRKQGLVHL